MSEVQSRPSAPARGRGSGRGGRGGYASRGSGRNGSRPTNGDAKLHEPTSESALPSLSDDGEVGRLKKLYGSKIGVIKEMFADWSEIDILFALQETDGDESEAVTRIAEGTISQWGEVSNQKKDRSRPKATKNDTFTTTTGESANGRFARGGRAEGTRGSGRGRATERGGGRGGSRGKSAHAPNGSRDKENQTLASWSAEAGDWDNAKVNPTQDTTWPSTDNGNSWSNNDNNNGDSWGNNDNSWNNNNSTSWNTDAAAPDTTAGPVKATSIIPQGTTKSWANILKASTAPKPAPVPKKEPPPPAPVESAPIEPLPPVETAAEQLSAPEPIAPADSEATPQATPQKPSVLDEKLVVVPEVALTPSKDQLTETNLERIPDPNKNAPPMSETLKSEAASSYDPRAPIPSAAATPISASQQQHQAQRAPSSGFAATALKATERPTPRMPSYQRRILDQEEAVRMPGNRDQVDRGALQFGAFSLNGPIDDDIDGDREEPETRAQPPIDSPIAQPRASLPPTQPAQVPDAFPPQKPAVALPPTGPAAAAPPNAPTGPAAAVGQGPPPGHSGQAFGRFGQSAPQESAGFATQVQKPFDSLSQQQQQQPGITAAQSQFDAAFQNQHPTTQSLTQQAQQMPVGAYSSASGDFPSSYYTADQHRGYGNFYGQNYGQQQSGAQGQQQEGLSSQQQGPPPPQAQRSFSGYNAPQNDNLSQYPQSGVHGPSRFANSATAEAQGQGSGNTTPNPPGVQAQLSGQSNQGQQSHGQQQQPHDYQYGAQSYYNSPYYAYYNQGYGQSAYGAAPYGKGGYGQPSQYGMQGPHGYGNSPAASFGQTAGHREGSLGGVGGGLSDYARGGSAQSAAQQGLGGGHGFGGMHEAFARGASGYQSQAGQGFSAAGSLPGNGPSGADELKPFGDAKGGPSPSLAAAARPGSANNTPSQSGLPPPPQQSQSNQQSGLGGGMGGGYGYPSHMQGGHNVHGSQQSTGGYGMNASGGQGHQNNYGGYQSFGGGNYGYGGNQTRGWGNNYH